MALNVKRGTLKELVMLLSAVCVHITVQLFLCRRATRFRFLELFTNG